MARSLICIGGPLHRQTVEMPEGKGSYVDLASSTCYIVREPMCPSPDGGMMAREVMMHETIIGDEQHTQMALIDAVMQTWFAEGRKVDVPNPVEQSLPTQAGAGPRTTRSGIVLP